MPAAGRSMPQGQEAAATASVDQPELLPLPAVTSLAAAAVGEGRLFTTFQNQLDALEEKFSRQLSGFQGQLARQSKRLVEAVLQPMEAKVSAMEGRERKIDCQLSDLAGSVRGLMEEVQVQVHRTDKADAKFRHWRKLLEEGYTRLEDDAQRRYSEFKQDLADLRGSVERCEAAAAGAAATATEVSTFAAARAGFTDRSLALESRGGMLHTEHMRMELGQANMRQELDILGKRCKDLEARVTDRGPEQDNDMSALDLVAELRGELQKALERTQDTVNKVDKLFDDAEEMGGHGMLVAVNSRLEKHEERHRSLEAEVRSVAARGASAAPSSAPPARDARVEKMWEVLREDIKQLTSRVMQLELARQRGELPGSSLASQEMAAGQHAPPPPPTGTVPWSTGAMVEVQAVQKRFDEELLKLKATVREQPPSTSAKEEIEPDLKAIWSTMSDIVDVVETAWPGAGSGIDTAEGGPVCVEAVNIPYPEDAITSDELQHHLSKVWGTLGEITELMHADPALGAKMTSNGLYDVPTIARSVDSAADKIVEAHTVSVEAHTVSVEAHAVSSLEGTTSIEDAVAMAAQSVSDANTRSAEVFDAVQDLSKEVAMLQEMVSKVREEDAAYDHSTVS